MKPPFVVPQERTKTSCVAQRSKSELRIVTRVRRARLQALRVPVRSGRTSPIVEVDAVDEDVRGRVAVAAVLGDLRVVVTFVVRPVSGNRTRRR